MHRFLIESPHREQDCLNVIQLVNAQGYLTRFEWGCMNGVHTGWAVIDAENEAEAVLAVPPLVRSRPASSGSTNSMPRCSLRCTQDEWVPLRRGPHEFRGVII